MVKPGKRIFALALAAALLALCACTAPVPKTDDATQETPQQADGPFRAPAYANMFAAYEPYDAEAVKPKVPAYTVEANLANIENRTQFLKNDDQKDVYWWYHTGGTLSGGAAALIEKNGFAVSDNESRREYFSVYEDNRYNYIPSFLTTDSALHTFHLMFDYVLKDLEQNRLFAVLRKLTAAMCDAAAAQYQQLKGTSFENAALRNAAYFSVALQLLGDKNESLPSGIADLVKEELALVEAHAGVAASPVINMGETYEDAQIERYNVDYSQFVPRSHYTQTETLQKYFKAMQWYGQLTFRSKYEDEVKSALLLTSALAADAAAQKAWNDMYEPTAFFVGDSDDITPYQYKEAVKGIYGGQLGDASALPDKTKFAAALKQIQRMQPPQINSTPIYADVENRDEAITGLRFMGQRFTLDAAIFQRLMDREVKNRMLPNSLDIPAALGSGEAEAILKDSQDKYNEAGPAWATSQYPQYAGQLKKVQEEIIALPPETWSSNLYWGWLNALRPLAGEQKDRGYPFFMQSNAWLRKELNTFQGSWTELKHDTLLYSKQPMGEMGAGGEEPPPPPDDRGYVEPSPVVFGRLAALVQQMIDGLTSRGLLTDEAKEALATLGTIARQLTTIAEKELKNEERTEAEYEFIRTYGGELEHIWQTAKKDEMESTGLGQEQFLWEHPDAVVADVATHPDTETGPAALEEATGYAKEIYVAFPRGGKVVLARGVVYSHYEFTVTPDQRLTDAQWHERLRNDDIPAYASWKSAFLCDAKSRFLEDIKSNSPET
ncbi:MAG: DUF3160 domain-containing protein [Oscillospiraceae bacterium]|jgi:hypothetical protein|nr:DUF3160 domain-containing protein [Oscillospiraceae bacterium]